MPVCSSKTAGGVPRRQNVSIMVHKRTHLSLSPMLPLSYVVVVVVVVVGVVVVVAKPREEEKHSRGRDVF